MPKLTKRAIGLLDGYKTTASRVEITRKLGEIEHKAERLAEEVCSFACQYLKEADDDEIRTICEACPMTRLLDMIR